MNGHSGQQRRWTPTVWLIGAAMGSLAILAGVKASASGGSPALPTIAEKPAFASNLPQTKPPAAAPAQAASKAKKASTTKATYVGDDTCSTCHGAETEGYAKTPHHRTADPRTPAAGKGCESCHGPGSEHAADPTSVKVKDFATEKPADINAQCETCHNKGEHALWTGSQHESRGLACTTCHSMHAPKSETKQLTEKTQMELCAKCHRDKVSKLDRSGHMPVREGKMTCTSCHNVHGSTNTRLLRKGDSVSDSCTSCHADKRGPYLWEHAPVRDGCVTCHDPHGSSNERMLVTKPPLLCQRCHVGTRHPSTIYDSTQITTSVRVYARSCVVCHATIHGSNHPSGQFFVR